MLRVQVLTFQGMELTSNDTKKKYECICGSSYNQSAGLLRHKKTCQALNTELQEGYTCSTCNKVFNQKDNRDIYLRNCMNKPEGVPPCFYPGCGRQFSSNYKLRHHVSQVHVDEENRPGASCKITVTYSGHCRCSHRRIPKWQTFKHHILESIEYMTYRSHP